jgi:hypothetical protein
MIMAAMRRISEPSYLPSHWQHRFHPLAAACLTLLFCLPSMDQRESVLAAPRHPAFNRDAQTVKDATPSEVPRVFRPVHLSGNREENSSTALVAAALETDSSRSKPSIDVAGTGILTDSACFGPVPWPPRPVRNFSFGVGETLHYDIGWQSIVAGKGQMTVGQPVDTNQRLCFPIISTVESTPFFSTFYRVDDSAISFVDVRQLYPVRFEKYLREGKYRSDQIAEFDPTTGKAYTPKDTIPIPPYVQDALSLLYYVRTLDLKPDTEITVENFAGKKTYTLTVRVLHRERIEVKAGTFSTIVVEPLLQAAGLFKQEGKLKVWLTDDRLHLPVLMKTKVLVGSIVAELTDYRLGTVRRYSQ